MKLRTSVILLLMLLISFTARPDEGMWLPILLKKNYAEMQRLGLKLTPEQMYDINNSCLKDAIVMLDFGSCTGEMISSEGLLLTNHHCGFSNIQNHSSVDHDYLTDGFWAMTKAEELSNPGKTASFLIRMEDVTAKILDGITDEMTEEERYDHIFENQEALEKEAIGDSRYSASIESMFESNEYYLFIYETFKDVRLVGAPPSSIGKFGGNTDNWMWPRHTGDFSLFRVYTSPNGEPAEFSSKNIPMKPKYSLPIGLKGFKENDFAMIWGYPGSTDRYLSSFGIKLELEQKHPNMIKITGKVLDIMKADMDANDEIRIKYATKHARGSNSWKYYLGQEKGLKDLNVIAKKVEIEEKFNKWAALPENIKHKDVIKELEYNYKILQESKLESTYLYFRFTSRYAELLSFSNSASSLYKLIKKFESQTPTEKGEKNDEGELFYEVITEADIQQAITNFKKLAEIHFKDYDAELDKKLFVALVQMMIDNVPEESHPEIFKEIKDNYKSIQAYADVVYFGTNLASKEKLYKMLEKPTTKVFESDPVAPFLISYNKAYGIIKTKRYELNDALDRSKRLFIAGLRKMSKKNYYPDANSTMRCTYGSIMSYKTAERAFPLQTYLSEIIKKEDKNNPEFTVSDKLKSLYAAKDYGRYGVDGKLPVGFLTNNDITGGNSGSPVLNGNGELIGTAFDGNWEAMSGDIAFEPNLQRTIVCDIRYVLFIIDKYAGAGHLIKEMNIRE